MGSTSGIASLHDIVNVTGSFPGKNKQDVGGTWLNERMGLFSDGMLMIENITLQEQIVVSPQGFVAPSFADVSFSFNN